MTRNEAAERLLADWARGWPFLDEDETAAKMRQLLDEALATERRLTVERAARVVASHGWGHAMPMDHEDWRDGESAFDHINRHLDDLATAAVDEEAGK